MKTETAIKQYSLYIDGELKESSSQKYFDAINPSDGRAFAQVADATVEDMRAAVRSARQSFDSGPWKNMPIAERGMFLKRIADGIRKHAKELADLEITDTGKTAKQATFIDVPTCADTFEHFAGVNDWIKTKTNKVNAPVKSLTQWEPMGVVGCIIPWNYPLIMTAWKIAPALIAGNSVILKPSPVACVSIMRLAKIIEDAQLPEGVINIVASSQADVSEELVKNPKVDMISFTGSTATGKHIMRLAADQVKKVSLELGGKSPNIVFDDCDVEAAVGGTMSAIFMNQGQMCTAASRLFVQEKIYDQFLEKLIERTKKLKIGRAENYETDFGPLVSKEHRDKVLTMINEAVANGARLRTGGRIPADEDLDAGFFLEPAILDKVTPAMPIVQEEVFGPVLTVMKFKDVREVIDLANDTQYGLAACVWTKDLEKAERLAAQLQCGTVWINTYGGFYNETSFGGYKQSGKGRELGLEGLLEYTQSKHVCTDQTPGGRSLVSSWF